VIRHLLGGLLEIYLLLMFARALLSWFSSSTSPALAKINAVLIKITEPVLKPIQKIIPPIRIGGAYLDLSILIFFLVAQFLILPILLR
jgi:YggT family protein